MKIDIASDLHIRSVDELDWQELKNKGSEVLIVAGDTSNKPDATIRCLARAVPHYEAVLFVDGNHEHYLSYKSVSDCEKWLAEKAKEHGLNYLNGRKGIYFDDVFFIGANGWYDWNAEGVDREQAHNAWLRYSNDSRYIRHDIIADRRAERDFNWLVESIGDGLDIANKAVVITHTAPMSGLLEWEKDEEWKLLNGSYCNSHMSKLWKEMFPGKISTWIYGHSHFRKDLMIDGVRFVNNVRGYHGEIPGPWGLKQIEV